MNRENFERIQSYIENINLRSLLEELKTPNIDMIIKEAQHFTEKEAEKRDQIVLGYFGETGVKRVVDLIVDLLLSPPKLRNYAKILDVGAGSGFFHHKDCKTTSLSGTQNYVLCHGCHTRHAKGFDKKD